MVKAVYAEDSSQTRDRMAIRHFSDAINNLQVQWEISRQDFSSFEEVIQYAVERETYFGRDDSGRIRHLESDESSTVRDEIKALQLTVAKLVDTKANSAQKAPLCCKHCGVNITATFVTPVIIVGKPITIITVPQGKIGRQGAIKINQKTMVLLVRKTSSSALLRTNRVLPNHRVQRLNRLDAPGIH